MPEEKEQHPSHAAEIVGPAKDFRTFVELEFERRRSSQKDFDAGLFDDAVDLVLDKLRT
jgi:hypothetical protein